MTLLDRLKSLLGMSRSKDPASEVDVTVEREREEPESGERPVAEPTDAAGSTESIVNEDAAAEDPETAAEPAEAASSGDEIVDADPDADDDEAVDAESDEDGDESGSDDPSAHETVDVEEIKGIGPAYADELAAAGVESVDDLAAADAGELADVTGLGESRVERWIDRANDRGD